MKKIISALLGFIFVFSFYAPVLAKKKIEVSALDKRATETKIYDTKSDTELMKIALNLFQNEDYEIVNVDDKLNTITAKHQYKKPRSTATKVGSVIGGILITGASFGIDLPIAVIIIKDGFTPFSMEKELTLNVTNLNQKENKVRINSFDKTFVTNSMGGSKKVLSKIEEGQPDFYKDFYVKMDKEVFISKQNI
jgi:hypothetical protein